MTDPSNKARARTAALNELNGSLATLEQQERRVKVAARRLERVELDAQADRDQRIADAEGEHKKRITEAERDLQRARAAAWAIYRERVHAASSERGTAESLAEKARGDVKAARARLMRLLPADVEVEPTRDDAPGAGA